MKQRDEDKDYFTLNCIWERLKQEEKAMDGGEETEQKWVQKTPRMIMLHEAIKWSTNLNKKKKKRPQMRKWKDNQRNGEFPAEDTPSPDLNKVVETRKMANGFTARLGSTDIISRRPTH